MNKFEGDAALCVFGAPTDHPDPAGAALRAARRICDAVREAGEVDVGVGVACGRVWAGQVGAASRLEYTVIGDPVNEAARLTELAKDHPRPRGRQRGDGARGRRRGARALGARRRGRAARPRRADPHLDPAHPLTARVRTGSGGPVPAVQGIPGPQGERLVRARRSASSCRPARCRHQASSDSVVPLRRTAASWAAQATAAPECGWTSAWNAARWCRWWTSPRATDAR